MAPSSGRTGKRQMAADLPSPLSMVQSGALAGISLAPIENDKTDPLQEYVIQRFPDLGPLGIEYHEFQSSNYSVLFNPERISIGQIEEAFAAGKLFEVAPLIRNLAPSGSL